MIPNTRKNQLWGSVRSAHPGVRFTGEDQPSMNKTQALTFGNKRLGEGFRVSLFDSPLWFDLYHHEDSFDYWFCERTTFSPGYRRERSQRPLEWENVLEWFDHWLSKDVADFIAEQSAPDLWATAQQTAIGRGNWKSGPNTPFLPDELTRIVRSIDEMRSALQAMGSSDADFQSFAAERLEALLEESRRMGRKDWIMFAMGSAVTLATGASVTPEIARAFFEAALRTLSWLAGGPLLPTGL